MSVATAVGIARPHILAIAGLAALTFGWIFSGRLDATVPLLIALDWFVVNLANRAVDVREDLANGVPGTEGVARHARAIELGCAALIALSLGAGHLLAPHTTAVRALFHAIGLAYNYKLLPGRRRFKELYFFKNAMSGVLFVLSVQLAPALHLGFAEGASWVTFAWLVAFFFPLELSYEVIYDLRDIEGDRAGNVPTYPVVHGEAGARRIVWALIALAALVLGAGTACAALRLRDVCLIGGPLVQAALVGLWLRPGMAPTVGQCVAVTWIGAGLQAAYVGWILVGLPLGATTPLGAG